MPDVATERLIIKPICGADAKEAWSYVSDERMWKYFPHLRPATVTDLRRLYEKWERGSPNPEEIWWNFFCRERSTGSLVGAVQATVIPGQRLAHVAYAIYVPHQGRGYGRESVKALMDRVAEAFGITRFRAEIDVRNQPSCRLVEALGFERLSGSGGEVTYEWRTLSRDARSTEA